MIEKKIFNKLKILTKMSIVVCLCSIAGIFLLCIAYSLPTERITRNVENSANILEHEGVRFSVTQNVFATEIDNYTEALYLTEAMVGKEDDSLLKCVLSGYIFDASNEVEIKPIENLVKIINQKTQPSLRPISCRFFNGYILFIKIALTIMTYGEIRELNLYICLFITLWLFHLMRKRGLKAYIAPVFLSILFIRPLSIALSLSFVFFYFCMILPCIVILSIDKATLQKYQWLIFTLTGAITFYLNMNYLQILSFAIPMTFIFLVDELPASRLNLIQIIANCFCAWFFGYCGMMITKWLMYAALVNPRVFADLHDNIVLRMSSDQGSRFYGLLLNYVAGFNNKPWFIAELCFVLHEIANNASHDFPLSKRMSKSEKLFIWIMVALPIIRCLIFPNHVIIHAWVMCRLFAIPVLALNVVLIHAQKNKMTTTLSTTNDSRK